MSPAARLAIVGGAGFAVLMALQFAHGRSSDRQRWSLAQRLAMRRVVEAQRVLFEARSTEVPAEKLREIDEADLYKSGLVGLEWSHLVSTQGSLQAKIVSTDPRWAAIFVAWFERAGAGPDRPVAIGASASFPALSLSARVAAEVVGARPIVAASLTASNYGATIPEFDLWRIEEVLLEHRLVEAPIVLLSPGGEGDRLDGFEEPDAQRIRARLAEIGALSGGPRVHFPENIAESIRERDGTLLGGQPAVYVNIGGHVANYGTGAAALALPYGFVEPAEVDPAVFGGDSVASRALKRGIPVVNVLNIRSIMIEAGLDPDFAAAGDSFPSPSAPYSTAARAVSLVAFLLLAGFLIRGRSVARATA